jgi:two-component system cell cycle sensor histidine kinase/response regulator CckA
VIRLAHPLNHRKIPWSLIFIFVLLAIGIGGSGYFYYEKQKEDLKREKQGEILAIADLKAGQINKWRQERLMDATTISGSPFIASHIQAFLGGQKAVRTVEEIINWLALLQVNGPYDGVFLLDGKGMAKVSIPASKPLGGRYVQSLIKEVMGKKKMVLSDLYRDEVSNKIYLDLLVPILIDRDRETLLVGMLLLRTDPHQFLYPLVQSWPTPSISAETLLVRREGAEVVFLNELRHQKDTALRLRIPVTQEQNPAAMAGRGIEGIIEGMDYRGVRVLAAIKPIKDSPWFLVAKVDQQEVYASNRERTLLVVVLVGVMILAAGGTVGLFWRHQTAQFYRKQYETELERQALEKHYGYLAKYVNDIIILNDHNLKILEVNDRAISSYGYTREELLQMDANGLRPPETWADLQGLIKKVDEQKGLRYEAIHRRKDGTTFPVEGSIRVIEVEGGRFYQSIIRDITERKRAEEEIRRTHAFLDTIIENIPDMILIKDAKDLRFLHANKASEELTGVLRGERIGKTAYDFFPKEEADLFMAKDREALATKKLVESYDQGMHTKHRGLRYFHTKTIPILDPEGTPQFLLIVSEDITERKQAEEALRKSEERFKDLYDNAPVGYHEYNSEGQITNVNRTDLGMLGYTKEEMIGQPMWKFNVEEELARQQILAKLAGEIPPARELERTYRRKDGTTVPVLVEDRGIHDEKGQIIGIRCIIQDITERKQAEEEREKLIRELQTALLKVKTLSGLVPICASCKKIRDDKGYWNQIESYISEHSEAEFSHGICPECARRLYPDLYGDEDEVEK